MDAERPTVTQEASLLGDLHQSVQDVLALVSDLGEMARLDAKLALLALGRLLVLLPVLLLLVVGCWLAALAAVWYAALAWTGSPLLAAFTLLLVNCTGLILSWRAIQHNWRRIALPHLRACVRELLTVPQ